MRPVPPDFEEGVDRQATQLQPSYVPLVEGCKRYGIGRTTAFRLARDGDVETFRIHGRTFVRIASLETLPERLGQRRHGLQGVRA